MSRTSEIVVWMGEMSHLIVQFNTAHSTLTSISSPSTPISSINELLTSTLATISSRNIQLNNLPHLHQIVSAHENFTQSAIELTSPTITPLNPNLASIQSLLSTTTSPTSLLSNIDLNPLVQKLTAKFNILRHVSSLQQAVSHPQRKEVLAALTTTSLPSPDPTTMSVQIIGDYNEALGGLVPQLKSKLLEIELKPELESEPERKFNEWLLNLPLDNSEITNYAQSLKQSCYWPEFADEICVLDSALGWNSNLKNVLNQDIVTLGTLTSLSESLEQTLSVITPIEVIGHHTVNRDDSSRCKFIQEKVSAVCHPHPLNKTNPLNSHRHRFRLFSQTSPSSKHFTGRQNLTPRKLLL